MNTYEWKFCSRTLAFQSNDCNQPVPTLNTLAAGRTSPQHGGGIRSRLNIRGGATIVVATEAGRATKARRQSICRRKIQTLIVNPIANPVGYWRASGVAARDLGANRGSTGAAERRRPRMRGTARWRTECGRKTIKMPSFA